jgi:serine phosphatase RsbU (regulator of sigma subunit)
MLSKIKLINKTRLVWIILFALSPVAYLAGSGLIYKYDPNLKAGFEIDRRSAIEEAARFAASRGIDVTGWKSMCKVTHSDDKLLYYRLDKGRESRIARQLAPEIVVNVVFRTLDELESIEVQLGPDGRALGYTQNFSRKRELGEMAEPEARRRAVDAIISRLAGQGLSYNIDLKLEENVLAKTIIRKYTWKWPLTTIPELTLSSEVSFRGGVLTGDKVTAEIDSAFAKTNLNSGSILKAVVGVVYGLLFAASVIFGLYRFAQRVKQQEMSYSRITMVTIVFASMPLLFLLLTDLPFYEFGAIHDSLTDWVMTPILYFTVMAMYGVYGLFMGFAYGGGEGDIRESYPGKLTSLDSLVTGRLFSQNISRAFLIGCAMGGWVLWLVAEAFQPWQGKAGAGEAFTVVDPMFGYFAPLSPLVLAAMDVIPITVIGLLIPLPFLHRRFQSRRVIIGLSSIFVWLVCTGPGYLDFRPWTPILLMAAVRAFFFLLAFFYFDLLTAIFCLASATSWGIILQMIAQPSPGIRNSGIISLALAAASILIAAIFAFKGRFYRDDDVRPLYAALLAERVSMQAEVSAASEAQKRLMPKKLPSLPNYSIAARCRPAYEVGGDFYDVFELHGGKLGILIAEGGGKGLGSALSVAFAKGFLTPRILGNGESDNSPTEIMRGLQDRLAAMLDDEAGIGLAYAVIDAGDGALRYARVGTHPVIMVANEKSPGRLAIPEEREIKFKSNKRQDADISVIEGSYSLGQGDSVAMLTDGIIKNWKNNKTSPDAELSRILNNAGGADSAALQSVLDKNIEAGSKRARKQMAEDDLTAVIIKLNQKGE